MAAETFIRLIDEIAASREEDRRDRLLAEQILAEQVLAEQIQAECWRAGERSPAKKASGADGETPEGDDCRLSQENEKLKKDLQRLKALEIELEKRERMLR